MQNTKQVPEPIIFGPAKYEYKKSGYAEIFQVLQSFRKDEIFCDIKLETDDGGSIFGHKVVLASASPYFHKMFTNFKDNNQDIVAIKNLDSTALKTLVEFIYSGQVTVSDKNVQVLLPASNVLQLQDVKEVCCDFLQAQLCLTNCIDIFALADLYSCTKLLSSSELYIQQHFSDVVEGNKFLSLSSEQVTKLIASEELKVPSEEKVFESVIRWVRYDLDPRKQMLSKLMAHVRLPLTSKGYILNHVDTEPLLNNCPKCKDYVIEALRFHLHKSEELITIPHNIRTKPRQPGGAHKVILVVGGFGSNDKVLNSTEWYDSKINQWQSGPKISSSRHTGGLAVLKDNIVLYMVGYSGSTLPSVDKLDLSLESPNWEPTSNMLVQRQWFAVGVIKNCIYAVGGIDGNSILNTAKVFDCRTQKWSMISNMSTRRAGHGLGVLKNLLYAIIFRSYWSYTGVWSTIPDMHLRRRGAAVLDGLLYVVGGYDGASVLDSVEYYNPNTNSWTMITASMNVARRLVGVGVIDMPRYFKTC